MNKISVATYVKKHAWSLCHLWLQRDLEKTTISTNWRCGWIFCLLVWEWTLEMIGRNYLPALIPSRAVLLHCSTSQMKWVFTRSGQLTCLNYPCSTDAEIQCQLFHVLGTGSCNNDGVHLFFFLRSLEFWLLLTSLLCDAPQNGWKRFCTPSSCLTFSGCGIVFLKFGIFFALSLEKHLKSTFLSMSVMGENLPN